MSKIAIDRRIVDFKQPSMFLWSGAVRKTYPENNVHETLMGLSFVQSQKGFSEIQGFPKPGTYSELPPIELSVAQFPFFRIGDVWMKGENLYNVSPNPIYFQSVEYGGEKSLCVTEVDVETKSYFINYQYFKVPYGFRQGKMIRLRNGKLGSGNVVDILIPCFECIRYFFLGSSNFIHEIFSGGMDDERIYFKDSIYNSETRDTYVHVPWKISREDAQKIAWMLSHDRYRESAKSISKSLEGKLGPGKYAYPECLFPFLGEFSFSARGIFIPQEGSNKRVFLVFEIMEVGIEAPFKSILFHRKGDNQEGSKMAEDVVIIRYDRPEKKNPLTSENLPVVADSGSSANTSASSLFVYPSGYGSSFGHDPSVELIVKKKEIQKYISINKIKPDSLKDGLYATNSRGRSGSGHRSVMVVPKKNKYLPSCELIIKGIFDILSLDPEYSCEWVKVNSLEEGFHSFFPDSKQKSDGIWRYVYEEEKRLRRCYIFSVTIRAMDKTFYFFEIERKLASDSFPFAAVSRYLDFGKISPEEISGFLRVLAGKEGRWMNTAVNQKYRLRLINHSFQSFDENPENFKKTVDKTVLISVNRFKAYMSAFSNRNDIF